MMAIYLVNVTPGEPTASYRVQVLVTPPKNNVLQVIGQGYIGGHNRDDGWRALIKLAAEQCDTWEDVK